MNKKHIALVGGQPYPVYRGIIDHQPDEVILICSETTEKQAEILKREIQRKMDIKITIDLFTPVDLSKIRRKIVIIEKKINRDDEIVVNLSSGTKPWSILFYEYFFKKENVKCIFIDQNNFLWDFSTNESRQLDIPLSLDETLGLNNIAVNYHHNFESISSEDIKTAKSIMKFRARWPREYKALTDSFNKQNDQNVVSYGQSTLSWDNEAKKVTFKIVDKEKKEFEQTFSSQHIYQLLFNTGWFELEVADFLSQWEYAKEIWMNCKLTNMGSNSKKIINEIDIIVNTGEKLLFVECKTQVHDRTDIDKFGNAVKSYGGLASKCIFVTDAVLKPETQEKCRQAKIPFYAMSDMRGDESKRKMFFKFLTKELKTINEK